MSEEIKVPSVGESVTEGVLAAWSKQDGDFVEMDEPLFEFETDKVTMPVNSAFEGALHIQTPAGSKVNVGDVVGTIDTSAQRPAAESALSAAPAKAEAKAAASAVGSAQPAPSAPTAPQAPESKAGAMADDEQETGPITKAAPSTESTPSTASALSTPPAPSAPSAAAVAEDFPPSVRRMLEEYRIRPGDVVGTGKDGRVTKEDVIHLVEERKGASDSRKKPVVGAALAKQATPPPPSPVPAGDRRQTRTPMRPLRKRVAQRLVEAQQTAAMVTTYNEADLSAVLRLRDQYNEAFEKRYGIRMGFLSFFIKAAVDALKAVPSVNAQIDGDDVVENHFYDIGVAVSTEKGLVVPILRDCDRMSLAQLELAIQDFARRARERKLTLDDLAGGSFSISNGGVFGSLLSAPMLNPPQSGILGMHAIKKRPVVVDDQIVIRPMMYLALTYDHRIVDGREGVTFLKRIVECVENPERLLLEV